ncbi:MAG: DMT family transporter [Burkholderiales bacterium]|nr:DMT family transporter [Burkholderiales bacterium]
MRLALLAAAATGVQVGAAIVASRMVVADVPPLTLAMLRYGIGFLCLLPFVFKPWGSVTIGKKTWSAVARLPLADVLAMAALGLGQFAILIALLNFGLQHIGAAQAALIFSLFPLLTLLLSAVLGREPISTRLLLGVLLSIAGVALSMAPKLSHVSSGLWWGELAVLASACVGAICSVFYRPYLQRYPTLNVSAFAMLASVLFLAALALQEDWPARVPNLLAQTWAVVTFIGASSGIGYFLWLYALKHESPTRVTVFLALNPLTAALLGALLLHEMLDGWLMGAIALIGAGLWLATRLPADAERP